MSPNNRTVIAMIFYAITNVTIEQKFSSFSVYTIMLYWSMIHIVICALLIGNNYQQGVPVDWPRGNALLLVIIIGLVFFAADYLYLSAYALKGDVVTLTTIFIALPAVAAFIKWVWLSASHQTGLVIPSLTVIGGYILVGSGVFLITKYG